MCSLKQGNHTTYLYNLNILRENNVCFSRFLGLTAKFLVLKLRPPHTTHEIAFKSMKIIENITPQII